MLGVGKKLLGFIAVIVFLLFAIGLVLYWNYKGDRFNYADTEAVELTSSEDWVTIDWTGDLTLEVEQAQTVIYWHNEPTVRGNCKRETIDKKHFGNNLRIRHDNCLLVLPNTAVVASTNEADIVIVQPLASINMQSERSNIRIATNDQPYRFALSADNSKVGTFDSAEDAPVTISIESRHATIMPYTQR